MPIPSTHLSNTQDPIAAKTAERVRLPETGFLREWQILSVIPFSRSTLWRRVAAKTFPLPIKLSERVTVWRAEEVWAWIRGGGAIHLDCA